MTCEHVRAQLTSYLEGELGDAGTAIRGHLRTCEACRVIAADEAVLRDGLRALPPLDPPASLWAGVQARLAAEEVAESQRPAWRRALARWQRFLPAPRVAIAGSLVAAAAAGVIVWKTRSPELVDDQPAPLVAQQVPPQQFAPQLPAPVRRDCTQVAEDPDVTADLALDGARQLAAYDCAIAELLAEAANLRGTWSETQRAAFDDQVKVMRDAVQVAADDRHKQRVTRAMVRYLQGAVTRDQVLLAGVP